ncbi:hypothetical protein [Nonomuraea sp. NPDC049695]|uniref:hypothetical protein n=1 Tax=Nonomuraea sp. NPDC049695 TaxID=3154734 RepID=UPI003426CC80
MTLVGIADYLTAERGRMRDAVRAEAIVMGQRTNALLEEATRQRTARAAMTARIAGWQDPKEMKDGQLNEAEVARLVGMTRQAVNKLLAKLQAEADDTDQS